MGIANFPKSERIVSQKLIDELFTSGQSHSLAAFPLRAVYMPRPQSPATQVLVSVPKRQLHHAVDRNRVKRQLREAYRHQKDLLPADRPLAIAFIWQSSQILPSAQVDSRMHNLLKRIVKSLKDQSVKPIRPIPGSL